MAGNTNTPPQIMHGARALVDINGTPVGIAHQVSYSVVYDLQAANILGRFTPAELAVTGVEPVQVTCTGWRVYGHGPFAEMSVAQIQNLLTSGGVTIAIHDRAQTDPNALPIMTVYDCQSSGFNSAVVAKSLQELTVTYLGLRYNDENSDGDDETASAATF